jgi:hypothetical protein
MLYRITALEPRSDYRLWMRFEDGTEGEVDLSDIAGRGVFRRWKDRPEEFAQVQVDAGSGSPVWPGDLDVAPDRLYQELSGSEVEPRRVG